MKRTNLLLVIGLLLVGMCVVGCVVATDPETGEKLYAVAPKVDSAITTTGETLDTIGPAVVVGATAINPVAGSIVGLIVGIASSLFGCYKKWRVPLVESQTMLDKMIVGARAAADVIEEVVKPNADIWPGAKKILKKAEVSGAIMPNSL